MSSKKTVVLTTHNLEQAYRLSDSLVSLADGRLAPFPLVNLLRGTTTRVDSITYFISDSLRIEIPGGAPEHVVRTVIENARSLKFRSQGFEPD